MIMVLLAFALISNGNAETNALKDIEIPIVLTISNSVDPSLNQEVFSKIIFPEAERCLNTAFKAADADMSVKFKLVSENELSRSEEEGISHDLMNYHKINGQPVRLINGRVANEFEVVLSPRVGTSHVPSVLTDKLQVFYDSGVVHEHETLILAASRICKETGSCDFTNIEAINEPQAKRIARQLNSIYTDFLNDLVMSNRVYLNSDNFARTLNLDSLEYRASTIFAHEIMHAWGGLADQYHDSNEDNLMSKFSCVFDKSQVEQIKKYRGLNRISNRGER